MSEQNRSEVVRKREREKENEDPNVNDLGSDYHSQTKRQKPDCAELLEPTTKLIDVNDDCLQMIFEHLTFSDLFNLAIANRCLSEAASSVFRRQYSREEFKFTQYSIFMLQSRYFPHNQVASMSKSDDSAFLHNFGVYLKRLNVNVDNGRYESIEQFLLDKCSDSLTELTLGEPEHRWYAPEFRNVFEHIKKPFVNIVKLCLNRCHLSAKGSCLSNWFPQLRYLSLFDVHFAELKSVIANYPLLEHFEIGDSVGQCTLTKKQILNLLSQNTQIRSLNVMMAANDDDCNFLQRINEFLPELEQLHLSWEANSLDHVPDNVITFKNLKKLVLDFAFNSFSLKVVPFEFDQLSELEINNISLLTDDWMDFIVQNKALTKLVVLPFNTNDVYFDRPNNQDLMRFAKELSKLTALTVDVTEITTNCILQFLTRCDSVAEVHLVWNDLYGFNSFHHDFSKRGTATFQQIHGEWRIFPSDRNSIRLQRKVS